MCVALAILVAARAAGALQARPLALEAVVAEAAQAVYGTVTAVTSGRDEQGIPATWITIDVHEGLKGASPGPFTFKQFGVAAPLPDGTILRMPGAAGYVIGGRYVLFLHATSARGFTSPVGLGQGVYREETKSTGAVVVESARTRSSPRPLAAFLDEVRRRVAR